MELQERVELRQAKPLNRLLSCERIKQVCGSMLVCSNELELANKGTVELEEHLELGNSQPDC